MTNSTIEDAIGVLDWDGVQTWYRIVGSEHLQSGRAPVIVAHGGPGATHDYVEPLAALVRSGRASVLYDQVGAGRSSHHPGVPKAFWTTELFVRELRALLVHLRIDRYHFLGQSWGGMLGLQHALDQPKGLLSLVVANGLATIPGYIDGTTKLLQDVDSDIAERLSPTDAPAPLTIPSTATPSRSSAVVTVFASTRHRNRCGERSSRWRTT